MNKRKSIIYVTVGFIVVMALLVTTYALTQLIVLPNSGTIVTSESLEPSVDSIAWGTLYKETTNTFQMNVTNKETRPLTLNIAEDLDEEATGLHITWQYQSGKQPLPAGETATIDFTLDVDADAVLGPFSYNIIINELT